MNQVIAQAKPKEVRIEVRRTELVSRKDLVSRIRAMIRIVKNPVEEESMLLADARPVIPYYVVGVNTEHDQALKQYLAERLFVGAFEGRTGINVPLRGSVGMEVALPEVLNGWLHDTEARLSMIELDYLVGWCNPLYIRSGVKHHVSLYGVGVYQHGAFHGNRLTSCLLYTSPSPRD